VIADLSVVAFRRAEEYQVPPQKCFGFVRIFDQMPLSLVPVGDGPTLSPAMGAPIVTVQGSVKTSYRLSPNSHYRAVNWRRASQINDLAGGHGRVRTF